MRGCAGAEGRVDWHLEMPPHNPRDRKRRGGGGEM